MKFVVLICLFLLFFALFVFSDQISDTLQTLVFTKNNNQNIGTFKSGDKVKHTFILYSLNLSNKFVTDINVDCACSEINNFKKQIKPFEKFFVTIESNTTEQYGEQKRTANVYIEGKSKPVILKMYYVVE